jgi:predicted transposase YbfD/YdcC
VGLVTLAVKRVPSKANEIIVIPIVLSLLDKHNLLKGKCVSVDAMGCQKSIAVKIINYGANCLFNLKGNQSGLLGQVEGMFVEAAKPGNKGVYAVTRASRGPVKVGGRIETRQITKISLDQVALKWLTMAAECSGIASALMVSREYVNDKGENVNEVRYYISSLDLSARQMLDLTVSHWQVETLHNVLDCSFREDGCKAWKKGAVENLSTLRKLAISFLAPIQKRFSSDKTSMGRIFRALRHWECLIEYLTKEPNEVHSPVWWNNLKVRELKAFLENNVPILPLQEAA